MHTLKFSQFDLQKIEPHWDLALGCLKNLLGLLNLGFTSIKENRAWTRSGVFKPDFEENQLSGEDKWGGEWCLEGMRGAEQMGQRLPTLFQPVHTYTIY